MDFTNRSARPMQSETPQPPAPSMDAKGPKKSRRLKFKKPGRVLGIVYIVLLFSVTILVVATLVSLATSRNHQESKNIDKGQMQAVFLNNGQVYFGNIKTLNSEYLKLTNVYYLRVNQQVQPGQQQQTNQNDVSLAKLGCELHGPQDTMIVNRDQITFWENLKGDGQVAKAVAEFVKANPNGQKCQQTGATNSSSSDSSVKSNNSTTGTNNTSSNTTPSTPTTNNNTPTPTVTTPTTTPAR